MSLNSISTNIAAYYAQQNIDKASQNASLSVSRLSSGQRIVTAADDVAALAAGTTLQSQVTTLRSALQNASQGSSLLQVADGALAQITDILQRQKAIAVQASSGSVDDTQRAFLNQEFQALSSEIDRLSTSTNFNGVKLLDGSVFQANQAATNSGASAAGATRLSLSAANFVSNDAVTFKLGGNAVTFSFTSAATTQVQVLIPTTTTAVATNIDALVAAIQAYTGAGSSVLTGYTFSRIGNSLEVSANSTGTLASQKGGLIVDGSGFSGFVSSDATTVAANLLTLSNATDAGLGAGSTSVTGTVGDGVLQTLNNTKADVTLSFNGTNADFSAGTSTIAVGDITFNLTTTANTADPTQIVKGSTYSNTIDNIVQTLNAYTGNSAATKQGIYELGQLNFRRDGNAIVIQGDQAGSVYTTANAAATVALSGLSNVSGAGTLSGTTTGVNVNDVNNAGFTGTISGFSASFVSTDKANISVTVGGIAYTASGVNTNPSSAANGVLFTSANGGSFTIDMAANGGTHVTDQADADTFASHLNAAFSSLTFSQTRSVTSYSAVGNIITPSGTNIGSLDGTSVSFHLSDLSAPNITNVSVTAPLPGGTNAQISLTVNGEVFNSDQVGTTIAANQTVRLTSTSNANDYIDFHGPSTTSNNPTAVTPIDISTATNAGAVQDALKNAFGLNSGGQALDFQVGNSASDVLAVTIGTSTTDALGLGTASVASQGAAAIASADVDTALNNITSIRAGVGALEERFNFASAAISSSIQNQDAARGTLLDTDVATESTNYATSQVQLQAGIAVLAQANLLPQNLLKLIG